MTKPIRQVIDNHRNIQEHIRRQVMDAVRQAFPITSSRYTIKATGFKITPKSYSFAEEKSKILALGSTTEPLTANLELVENKTGKRIDQVQNFKLLNVPVMTGTHTFIKNGNNYSVMNVVTLKPGIYPRRAESGRLEAHFNLAGRNFRMYFDGEKQNFVVEAGGKKIPLFSILRAIGANDALMVRHWGIELVNAQRAKTQNTVQIDAQKFLAYLNPRAVSGSTDSLKEIGVKIREFLPAYSNMDPKVNERTVGSGFKTLNAEAFIVSAGKLLRLFKGDKNEKIEPRDNPVFKRLHTVDDQFAWDIRNHIPEMQRKISHKLDYARDIQKKGIRGLLPSSFMDKPIDVLLTQSQRKNMPTQVNPLEIMDTMTKVTPMGEMGIKTLDQVPEESRYLQNGHFGIIDPLRTPESKSTGVDLRLTTSSGKDDAGDMYAYVINRKTGKEEYVNVADLTKKVVAFPNQNNKVNKGRVEVLKDGQVQVVDPKEVQYSMSTTHHMLSPTSTLVPLIDGMQGNRVIMASQMMTQALSLKDREEPLVQTLTNRTGRDKGETSEHVFGKSHVVRAEITGTVTEVTKDHIKVKGHEGVRKHDTLDYYPLNQKSYMHHEPLVKLGDRVKKGQVIAQSNFTDQKGTLALGTNLRTAYLTHYGANTNDAIVISESAAKKLTSTHLTKKTYSKTKDSIIDRNRYLTVFPGRYQINDLAHLDHKGVVKAGAEIQGMAPLVLAMTPSDLSYENKVLGEISKKLVRPYRDDALIWDSDKKGIVKDVMDVGNSIVITILTEEGMVEGDKITGRFGNKGVISRILPDSQMPHTKAGEPLEVLMAPTGVHGRVNPNQVVETALGKVAAKTGQPIKLPHFNQESNVEMAKNLLKKHGLTDKEDLIDPDSGRKIAGVMTGKQYILKLLKQTHTNFNAHGTGAYDINEQPAKPGGDDSAIGLGRMEVNALISANARNYLKDAANVKGQRNDAYWNAVRLGLPTPKPQENFAYNKFLGSLQGAGIKVNEKQSSISLAPLTNRDIKEMSSGEISNPQTLVGKDYRPVKKGLFDFGTLGGLGGNRWGHINLAEDIVNPVFETNVRTILGITPKEFDDKVAKKGGKWFKDELNNMNIHTELSKAKAAISTNRGAALNKAIKKYNLLKAMKEKGFTRMGDALTLNMLPVTPPSMRPVIPLKDGKNVIVSDINHLYSDVLMRNNKFKEMRKEFSGSLLEPRRTDLYKNVKALVGLGPSTSKELKNKKVKGFLANLAGDSPKTGYIQSKLIAKKQDLTGRGTAIPDMTLDMDEVGLPEDMCWRMFEPYIMKELTSRGYRANEASKMIEDKHPTAKIAMQSVLKKYPVLLNRAPTLWRHNMVGAYVRPVGGKSIRVNPFIEDGTNLDYDGDTLQIHVPATAKGVDDVKRMTVSQVLFHDKSKSKNLLAVPKHEAVVGIAKMSLPANNRQVKRFKTQADAIKAYHAGQIGLNDPVEIG